MRKINKIFLWIWICSSIFGINMFAQNPNITKIDNQYVPKIFGSSPQAMAMAKVSEIPIDISTGRINYTIPLFEIKEGTLTMPVNLSYNYSGLLLDETPGYAGVGWTFNIGGQILHNIKALNDEHYQTDKSKIDDFVNHRAPYDTGYDVMLSSPNYLILMGLLNGTIDGETDKYTMNIGNINASFYLDKNNNPVFIRNENYQVIAIEGTSFKVVDDKGIIYKFSTLATGHTYAPELDYPDYVASYLITEISFPDSSNKIIFEYGDNTGELLEASVSQTKVLESHSWTGVIDTNRNINSYSSNGIKTPLLTKITTSNSTIEISYNKHPNETGVAIISNIKIKNTAQKITDQFEFAYSDWVWRRRNLQQVTHNGISLAQMEYDMASNYPSQTLTPMPTPININSIVLKKDLWGYYNSGVQAVTNSTDPFDRPSMKPNFNDTKIGSLTKITYPTKGYSVITYEPNIVRLEGETNLPYETEGVYYTGAASTSKAVGETVDNTFTINRFPDSSVEVKVTSFLNNDPNYPVSDEIRTAETAIYKDGAPTVNLFKDSKTWLWSDPQPTNTWQPSPLVRTTTKSVYLSNGTYHVKSYSNRGCTAKISATIKNFLPEYDQPIGGIRVKQTQNCDFNGICTTIKYNYTSNNKSTGILLQNPQFFSGLFSSYTETGSPGAGAGNSESGSGFSPVYYFARYYSYNSIYPLSPYRGSPVLYQSVRKELLDSNNNSKGSTVSEYYPPVGLLDTRYNDNLSIGMLKNEIEYAANDNNFLKKTTQNKSTRINNSKSIVYGTAVKQISEFRPGGPGMPKYTFNQPYNSKHESINYMPTKITDSMRFNQSYITQVTNLNYNSSNTGNLLNKSITTSDGSVQETNYQYAHEKNNQLLISKNMIGIPLETTTTQTVGGVTKTLGKTETVYPASLPTPQAGNLVLPLSQKSYDKLNSTSSTDITYDKYDEKGNLLQYTTKDGIPVAIVWGYNKTQPIAKVEGITYDQLTSTVPVSGIVTASDNDAADPAQESLLLDALNSFRKQSALSGKLISTYTYDPLIGVTSITPPSGVRQTYTYDSANRLKETGVRGKNSAGSYINKKMSENKYNYKP